MDSQVFPALLPRLGGSSMQQGLLLSALFFFYPLTSVAAGLLSDRLGKRRVVAAGLLLMGLPFALSALLPRLWMRTLAVLLFGLGAGAVESQTSALLADLHPERERRILNLAQTFHGAGAAAGPFLIALVYGLAEAASSGHAGELPLGGIFWAVAGLNAVLPLGFALSRGGAPRSGPALRSGAVSRSDAALRPDAACRSGAEAVSPVLRPDRRLRLLVLMIFLYVAMETGIAGWAVEYCETGLALPPAAAPLSLALFWGGHAVSRILAGLLPGRVSDRALLGGGLLLSLAAQVWTFALARGPAILAGYFLIGLGLGCVWPTLVAMAAAGHRQASGSAVGLVVAAGGLAVPAIHPLIGLLAHPGLLGLRASLLSLAPLALVIVVLVRRLPAPPPR